MNLAARNLLQDKRRVALSVAGVALALMLILILTGFVSGINLQLSRYLNHAPGSLVLVQSGSQGNSSVLPAATVATVREVAGVASAVPVISQYAVLDLGPEQPVRRRDRIRPRAGWWSLGAARGHPGSR